MGNNFIAFLITAPAAPSVVEAHPLESACQWFFKAFPYPFLVTENGRYYAPLYFVI